MANTNLSNAKSAKNDEFYTQFYDIEKEINAYLDYDPNVFAGKTILCPCDDPYESNFFKYFALCFQELKLKKLIATCYKGSPIANKQLSLFDDESAENKTTRNPHKIEITEIPDLNQDGVVNLYDVQLLLASDRNHLTRLQEDGDFRSEEVTKLRDEADMIVTNPPFSLFREFLTWITEANKEFLIIGNMNAITYKEVFPLIKENKMWMGATIHSGDREFAVPDDYPLYAAGYRIDEKGKKYIRIKGVRWFTNLDHGRRHRQLPLMTMAKNLRYNNKMKGKQSYDKYDNYDAIEVPATDTIPSDYEGIMGVPISFLDKYCPEQFQIVGLGNSRDNFTPNKDYINPKKVLKDGSIHNGGAINCVLAIETEKKPIGEIYYTSENSKFLLPPYARILIKKS
ncbi:MAG: adenine-specific methyltransferase EcoRI family protein [Marinilabiliaceae bacterium]|nr:adenine-specific methyltransferase EcoRI family protein [Marinilabiliaceae bacterium]